MDQLACFFVAFFLADVAKKKKKKEKQRERERERESVMMFNEITS